MNTYRRLVRYLRGNVLRLAAAIFLMAVLAGTGSFQAVLIGPMITALAGHADANLSTLGRFGTYLASLDASDTLPVMVVAIIVLLLVHGFADFGQSYFMGSTAQRVMRKLRDELFEKVAGLDLGFFRARSTGELMSRLTNDVMHVQQSVTEAVATSTRESMAIIGLVTVMFFMSAKLTVYALVVFPLAAVPILMIGRRIRKASRKKFVSMADLNQIMSETFRGIRIVQAFGMEAYEAKKFEKENRYLYKQYMKTIRARAAVAPVNQILAVIGLAIAIYIGWVMIQTGALLREQFISFMFAVFKLYPSIKRIGNVNTMVQEGTAASERIFELMDKESAVRDRPGAFALRPVRQSVAFENVSFGYGGSPVLKKINFRARAGQTIAIVGSSGAGKTTLVNLIPRFYDVEEGRIAIDGTDIRDATLRSLRAQIGMVTQEMVLFNDTVRNNIAYGGGYGGHDRGEAEVVEAAEAANAHGFISAMPAGYETVIGEAGVRLSGGERQRLSIARALLKNAPILILDEATSSLDAESEYEVQRAIENVMRDRTTFVIAHRFSTVRSADRILVLAGGEIVEDGRHEELLALGGEYRRLYDKQFRDADDPAGGTGAEGDSPNPDRLSR